MQVAVTPYEQFLRQSIEEQKVERDRLFNEFAKANPLRKQLLKRKSEEINENLSMISADLEKYIEGLEWLREPSKERDEKAEHLPNLSKEEAAPPAPAPAGVGAPKPTVARPTIGKPIGASPAEQAAQPAMPPVVGAPRPTIGTPVGRPQIGSPVGTLKTDAVKPVQVAATSTPVARPQIGTPVGGVKRPAISTPIGTPKTETPPPKPIEKKSADENQGESGAEKTDSNS